jgi:ELP3 family radical SAM enzyme/protein acetyltransferase
MPDLPHPDSISIKEMINLDKNMFEELIVNPDLQADQWKIYPCATIPYTKIQEEYNSGKYNPYGEFKNPDVLFELLIYVKSKINPWIRLNRVIRDIPKQIIIGGYDNVSMRDDIHKEMKKRGLKCRCIRCREVKTKNININDFELKIRKYSASEGIEYFISFENKEEIILGFLRLRIEENQNPIKEIYFPELKDCSLIRELHVYGQVICHYEENNGNGVQHIGLGKKMINEAIKITKTHKLDKISVISGVGVKNYYIKQGFLTQGNYLVKYLDNPDNPRQSIFDFKNDSSYDYVNEFSTLFCLYYITIIFSIGIYIFYNY